MNKNKSEGYQYTIRIRKENGSKKTIIDINERTVKTSSKTIEVEFGSSAAKKVSNSNTKKSGLNTNKKEQEFGSNNTEKRGFYVNTEGFG